MDSDKELKSRTYQYARRIIRLFKALPNDKLGQTLGNQLLRSGTSVGANYREALRGRSKAEFISCAGVSLRELDETDYWLNLIKDEKIFEATKLKAIIQETDELLAIFTTIIKNSKA